MAHGDLRDHLGVEAQEGEMKPLKWCWFQETKAHLESQDQKEKEDHQDLEDHLGLQGVRAAQAGRVGEDEMVGLDSKGNMGNQDFLGLKVSQVLGVQLAPRGSEVGPVPLESVQSMMASYSPDTARNSLSQNALQDPLMCTADTLCSSSTGTTELTDKTWVL